MPVPDVELHDVAISALLYDPAGGITRACNIAAQTTLLELARATINRTWPGPPGPFPPVGPPYNRTDNLRQSLMVIDNPAGPRGPESLIGFSNQAIRRGWNYGEILRDRGYRFLPDYFYV